MKGNIFMKNKVLVISTNEYSKDIEESINHELENEWFIKFFYEIRGVNSCNKIICCFTQGGENDK